jgi:hypothetical protein
MVKLDKTPSKVVSVAEIKNDLPKLPDDVIEPCAPCRSSRAPRRPDSISGIRRIRNRLVGENRVNRESGQRGWSSKLRMMQHLLHLVAM